MAIGLADEAHLAVRERGAARDLVARHGVGRDDVGDADEIIAREHAAVAAGGLADAPDAPVRDRAAHEGNFALARQQHVGHEAAAAVQMARVLLARDRGADALRLRAGVLRGHASSQNGRLPQRANTAAV